jgi:GNAT superfamily N-acetyltransferase
LEPATAERVWSQLLTSDFMTVIVAQATKQLVSSCTLAIVPNLSRGGRSYGVIENVVTHADHRRQGLGRRVLAHALDLAWQADCYKVLLATGSKRETTLRFYEEAGFLRGGKTYFEVRRP